MVNNNSDRLKTDKSEILADFSTEQLSDLADKVDKELDSGKNLFQFPDQLELLFDRETSRKSKAYLFAASFLALFIYDLFLFTDLTILADVFRTAVIIRLLVVTPLGLLVLLGLNRPNPAWIREGAKVVVCVGINLSLIYLMAISSSRHAIFYFPGIILIIAFGNIIIRLRFWYAVASSVISTILYLVFFPSVPGMPPQVQHTLMTILVASIVTTLFANFNLETQHRRSFLLELRELIRKKVLMDQNMRLTELSHIDALTGLANRREIEEFFLRLSKTRIKSIAIVMIDLDHFKNYNDYYGHPAGDDCLRQIGAVLNDAVHRHADLVGRFGGEEFVALLPDTSLQDALKVANRIRKMVLKVGIPHAASQTEKVVTISAGVAAGEINTMDDFQTILQAADIALYRSKSGGRNQVQS
jgi:diguanylate cyclase (GGDEF)-like protein